MKNRNVLMLITLVTALSVGACGNNTDVASVEGTEVVSTTESIATTENLTEDVTEETTDATEILPEEISTTEETEVVEEVENTEVESDVTTESQPWDENRTADTMDDLEQNYQDAMNSWTLKATWTASNGVVIKINDAYANVIESRSKNAIYYDGTEDLSPNSAFMTAVNEYIYGDEAYLNGTDRWNSEVVDVSKLPDIPCASSKQTSIPNSADFANYKAAFDEMYGFQVSGVWGANPAYCLQNYGSGIGLLASASHYLWTVEFDSSNNIVVTLKVNPSELQWDALHNTLRLLSPDGDALYNAIYEDAYYGATWISDFDGWYSVPNSSSEVYVPDYRNSTSIIFKFR